MNLCAYAAYSEWQNREIGGTWAYRDAMPVIPVLDAGLSPILQWIVVPLAGFWWASRPAIETDQYLETNINK